MIIRASFAGSFAGSFAAALAAALVACSAPAAPVHPQAAQAPLSLAADARMITIPAGMFIAGSTPEERAQAYDDYQHTADNDGAREHHWFDREEDRHQVSLAEYRIDLFPVTQAQFAEFVQATGAGAPAIDEAAWKAQGFAQDFATEVARFVWSDGRPPAGREDHPVVLVTWTEADAYCKWRGELAGHARRLPTAHEFEKAARGDKGVIYPWGNSFEPTKLNCAIGGPRDTMPVGSHLEGKSPYGVVGMAGNVFQWTSTPFPPDEMTVKGSAWEDFAGVGRGASAHGRARSARHVIVGFRCAAGP
ncbi:MAG: formylglycine-generating enzyme family protein [Kofleriaceae bacterium]